MYSETVTGRCPHLLYHPHLQYSSQSNLQKETQKKQPILPPQPRPEKLPVPHLLQENEDDLTSPAESNKLIFVVPQCETHSSYATVNRQSEEVTGITKKTPLLPPYARKLPVPQKPQETLKHEDEKGVISPEVQHDTDSSDRDQLVISVCSSGYGSMTHSIDGYEIYNWKNLH